MEKKPKPKEKKTPKTKTQKDKQHVLDIINSNATYKGFTESFWRKHLFNTLAREHAIADICLFHKTDADWSKFF